MLKFTKQIHNALTRATQYHEGQYRKMSEHEKIPYISHPCAVALILSEHTHDQDILTAALLHDLPEDTDYNLNMLREEFGERVHNIVYHLTEVELAARRSTTWDERKKNYLQLLQQAPKETLLIAIADKIHNLQSIIYAHQQFGDELWNSFENSNKQKQMWFHREVLSITKKKLQHPLVTIHEEIYNQALTIL